MTADAGDIQEKSEPRKNLETPELQEVEHPPENSDMCVEDEDEEDS
jgi:hypothetical protein